MPHPSLYLKDKANIDSFIMWIALQLDGTQETTLKLLNIVVERKLHLFVVWYGPFQPVVGV